MSNHETSRADRQIAQGVGREQLCCGPELEIRPPDAAELPVHCEVCDAHEQREQECQQERADRPNDVGEGNAPPPGASNDIPQERQDDQKIEVLQEDHGRRGKSRG